MPIDTHSQNDPLFSCDDTGPDVVTVYFEDLPIPASAGSSVAAALLVYGVVVFRSTPVSAAPRAPYCMMGVCFECLVEIDGVPNCQACLTAVREGMQVRRQQGPATLPSGVKGAGDVC